MLSTAKSGIIKDAKLLARVRHSVVQEYAGYFREYNGRQHVCLEPGCSCGFDVCGPFRDVCGPFRDEPARCTGFEAAVLGLDPDNLRRPPAPNSLDAELAEAYRQHVLNGTEVRARRCKWSSCRKDIIGTGPNARYCRTHAEQAARQKRREASRRWRQKVKVERDVFALQNAHSARGLGVTPSKEVPGHAPAP